MPNHLQAIAQKVALRKTYPKIQYVWFEGREIDIKFLPTNNLLTK